MQVNNIINLAYSAPAPAASPSAGLVADVAVPENGIENGLASFGDIIAAPVAPVSEIANDLQINDPQSGIIPIPQIYGAATPILAPIAPQPIAQQYIDLGNDGQISQDVLKAAFSKTAPNVIDLTEAQAQQILAQGNLGETFPLANEVENDADFDAQLASLQASLNKPEDNALSAKIAALNPAAASTVDAAKVQSIIDEHVNKLDQLAAATEDKISDNSLDAQLDAAIVDNELLTNNTLTLASVEVANKQVGDDFKDFDSKPIDANELKMGGKLHGIEHSKLEAQIKHLAQSELALRSPIEQIKVQISQGIELGQDKISIKLHPAELGKVDVEMNVDKEGKTHVRIVADRSETLEFLRRDSNELQKALRDVGMATDDSNLQFSLNQNQNGGNKGEGFANNNSTQNQAYKAAAEEYSNYVPQSQTEINLAVSQGGLNIVV